VHPTSFCYTGDADPSAPGGIAAVYRDLVADEARTRQVADDVTEALQRGRIRVLGYCSQSVSPVIHYWHG
jgi:hypothetical protein